MPAARGLLSESIIRALLYYDLFNYPLTPEEIFKSLPTNHVTPDDVKHELEELVKQSLVYKMGEFFSVQSNPELETRRADGNRLARKHLEIARRRAKVISRFPFVRSVMVSGSLSKGYADANSDIDFFVITRPGRLWITRSLLALYRRVAYLNSRKYFCINYFIDEDHLEIEEKNVFTATELTTLIPVVGLSHHQALMRRNDWVRNFFPNYQVQARQEQEPRLLFKRVAEGLINSCFPNTLDSVLMKFALRRWKNLYGQSLMAGDFQLAFKSGRSVSKSHPLGFQNKVISRYEERIRLFHNSVGS